MMHPFRLLRDEPPDFPRYIATEAAAKEAIRPPPCECIDCENGFYHAEEQAKSIFSYHRRLSDAEAKRSARSAVEDIQRCRSQLIEHIRTFGDVLMKRWEKRSQVKRAALLKEAVPELEEQQWLVPRYTYMRESLYMHNRNPTRRRQLLLPWLNVHVLKSNPAVLFALLHYRTAYPPQSWAPFDSRQLTYGWAMGFFNVDFSAKCVVMYGDRYGSLVDWEEKTAHRADTLGYPRAMLVLEAQAYLLKVLCNIVDKVLEGVDPLQPPRAEKWQNLVSHEAFKETGAVESWSPYTNQPFSRPPTLNCDYLLTLAKSRLEESGDHLWYLQCDSAYMRRHVKIIFATELFKKVPEEQRAASLTNRMLVEIKGHCWWRWIEIECKHVEAVHKRFRDSIYPGMALTPTYDRALGALELLLVNQVIYRANLLEGLLPCIPGMQRDYPIDSSQASPTIVRSLKLAKEAKVLTDDPLGWCLAKLQERPDDQRAFDHDMLFTMLRDHLSNHPSEGKRLDEITYRTLSDLATCHEMLIAVRSHRPQNTARSSTQVYATEHRESWKLQVSGETDFMALNRIGLAFIKDFHQVKPPTGPKGTSWISQSQALRTAMQKFWASVRQTFKEYLAQNNPAFTKQEMDSLLGVVSAHLSEQYFQDEQRAEAEILATIQSPEPRLIASPFSDVSQPSPASTVTVQDREKVKTRGEQGPSASDVSEPQVGDEGEVAKEAIITLPEESLGVIHLMFPSKDGATKDVTWNRFVNMMTRAGFTARNNTGSAVAFKQVSGSGAGGRIVFHKPHPVDKLDPVMLRVMGKRMAKWFGWKRELFALRDEKISGVQG